MAHYDEETGLLHYGVKGMKWGVQKSRIAGAARSTASKVRTAGAKVSDRAAKMSPKARAVATAAVAVGVLAGAVFVNGQVGKAAMQKSASVAASSISRNKQQALLSFINETGYRVLPVSANAASFSSEALQKRLGKSNGEMESYLNSFAQGAGAAYKAYGKGR